MNHENDPAFHGTIEDTTAERRNRSFWITDNSITSTEWDNSNEITEEYNDWYETHKRFVRYMAVAKDIAPTTGKKHLHIYVQFTVKRANTAFCNTGFPRGGGIHIIYPKTDTHRTNCMGYIRQKSWWIERGTAPESLKEKGERERDKWNDTLEAAKRGRFDDIDAKLQVVHYRNLQSIRATAFCEPILPSERNRFFWIEGVPGAGKSHMARELATWIAEQLHEPDRPMQKDYNTIWWDHYDGQAVTLIEDISPPLDPKVKGKYKNWVDKWTFPAEVKGGSLGSARPRFIIFTSNFSVSGVFGDVQQSFAHKSEADAMSRRLEQYTLYGNLNGGVDLEEYKTIIECCKKKLEIPLELHPATTTESRTTSEDDTVGLLWPPYDPFEQGILTQDNWIDLTE